MTRRRIIGILAVILILSQFLGFSQTTEIFLVVVIGIGILLGTITIHAPIGDSRGNNNNENEDQSWGFSHNDATKDLFTSEFLAFESGDSENAQIDGSSN